MSSIRRKLIRTLVLIALVFISTFYCAQGHAQAALLMEQPYGFFGAVNPTGHNAIYFERICAETPVKLRRCEPGEMGTVIARYQGIDNYDWVAIPLVPYLYSVENPSDVPARVDRATVERLRSLYREQHLQSLGTNLPPGNLIRGGWTQLVGAAYERRIYAFRFQTTPEQDDALIAELNDSPNHSHFNLLFKNCADFARIVLNDYFPDTFHRNVFPDAGMTTPKQVTYRLTRYARKHPELKLAIFEIPQVPGYRHESHSNKDIDESIVTSVYALPIAIVNPYFAGGLFADYLLRGRFNPIPKHCEKLGPENLSALTLQPAPEENRSSADVQAPGAVPSGDTPSETASGNEIQVKAIAGTQSSLMEIKAAHE
jgi:hypothetical protein